ncbi:hypothetical protein L861_19820 [Litchfieldella anticariensis FP35 = DSM 16096]|uniref:Uncharacterized protein n=1 Tax=Litchfieldella anticariensis (strain DSM 16096 / CECT 5854 / CIP 108499 / LMG 22089 / FP35) TaxID=1121939 RepID=S2KII0_LITA3|nr:hypothetical protein L861_19820 [Halomonas anticariensis FP35 = DSM 16096]
MEIKIITAKLDTFCLHEGCSAPSMRNQRSMQRETRDLLYQKEKCVMLQTLCPDTLMLF